MLLNIDPILSPDVLHSLAAMGHGDTIVIADANFPAESTNARTLRADGTSATDFVRAVLQLMPLDTYSSTAAQVMQTVEMDAPVPAIVSEFQNIIEQQADVPQDVVFVERFQFYEEAKKAFAVIQTGENRLYGNIILQKGVVSPKTT